MQKLGTTILLVYLYISCVSAYGQWDALHLQYPDKGFISTTQADNKDDALITGNGTIGAAVPGQIALDKILLSHERIYIPYFKPMQPPPIYKYLDEIRELTAANQGGEASKRIYDVGQDMGYPEGDIWWDDAYLPACYLAVGNDMEDVVNRTARSTDFETALTTVAWKSGQHVYHRKMFVSRKAGVAVMQIDSPTDSPLSFSLYHDHLESAPPTRTINEDEFRDERVGVMKAGVDEEFLTYKLRFNVPWETDLKGYDVVSRIIPTGGTVQESDGKLVVSDAKSILVITAIHPWFEEPDNSFNYLKQSLEEIPADFGLLLKEHAALHGEIYNRVDFTISKTTNRTSEELMNGSSLGNLQNELTQQLFHAARYGVVTSTGEFPPNLQGIWGSKWRAPWAGDFTHDGNVQAAIAAGLSGNHIEIMRSYLDYMFSLMDDFKSNAKELYDMRGIWVPSKSSTHGRVYHFRWFDNKSPYGFPGLYWMAAAAWTAQLYYDYWLYIGDKEYLQNKSLPFMLESAAFYEDYLYKQDGRLIVNPSYSPEINPSNMETCVVPNATMDVAAIKQLLRNLLSLHADGLLPVESDRILQWKEIIALLPEYQADENGEFKEWLWPTAANNPAHRHCSQLYPLYYEVDPDIASSEALLDACRKAIEARLDFRHQINGGSMSYGLSLLGIAAAHIGSTEQAYECVDMLANLYWTKSFASTHNPKRMMNMDISGGYPALIIEMLMYSKRDELELLPALPRQWPEGEITGLRAKGGFEVDIVWQNGILDSAEIRSLLGNPLTIKYAGKTYDTQPQKGELYVFVP
jgi:alpha-L-fucosidase 2